MDIPTAPAVPNTPKGFSLKLDPQRAFVYIIGILTFGLILFVLLYRSAKRRSKDLEEQVNDIYEQLAEREALLEEAQELTKDANLNFDSIKAKYFELKQTIDDWAEEKRQKLHMIRPSLDDDLPKPRKKKKDNSLEKKAWEMAKTINTIEAYQHFLQQSFPTKSYRSVATRKLNSLQKASIPTDNDQENA